MGGKITKFTRSKLPFDKRWKRPEQHTRVKEERIRAPQSFTIIPAQRQSMMHSQTSSFILKQAVSKSSESHSRSKDKVARQLHSQANPDSPETQCNQCVRHAYTPTRTHLKRLRSSSSSRSRAQYPIRYARKSADTNAHLISTKTDGHRPKPGGQHPPPAVLLEKFRPQCLRKTQVKWQTRVRRAGPLSSPAVS